MGFTSRPARWLGFGLVAFLAGRATVDRSPSGEPRHEQPALATTIDLENEVSLRVRFAAERPAAIDWKQIAIPGAPKFVTQTPDDRTLEIEFAEPLPRAQRFVISSPGVGSASCIELARFETAGPSLTDLHVQKPVDGERRLHLRFDLPIDEAKLERSLALRDARGTEVAIDVAVCENCMKSEKVRPGTSYVVRVPKLESPNEPAQLAIAADLTSTEGPVAFVGDRTRSVVFDAPLHFERYDAEVDSIVLYFDRELDAIDPARVRVEPATDFTCERSGSSALRISGDFPCGSQVRVKLEEGFPGAATARLEEPLVFLVEIPDREPSLAFVGDGIALSNQALPEVEIETVNVDAVRLRIREVFADSALHFLRQRGTKWRLDPDRAFSSTEKSLVRELVASKNETLRTRIDLRELLGQAPRGIFLIGIEDLEMPWSEELTLLEITDLGIALRVNDGSAIARVTSLASGTPVVGAEVELRSLSNRLLAHAQTDASGLCTFDFSPVDPNDPPFCAIASTADDRAFVDVKHFGLALEDRVLEGRPPVKRGGREAFIALDRPWIRPGDSGSAAVLLRDRDGNAAFGALDLTCFDAGQAVRSKSKIDANARGVARFTIDTAASDRSGIWYLEIADPTSGEVLGRQSFVVADSEPENVDVDVKFAAPLAVGSDGQLEIAGQFLSGGPLTEAPLAVYVDWRRAPFPSVDGYSFAGVEDSPIGASEPIRSALDANGRATIGIPSPELGGSQRLIADITVEVEERSGRTASRQLSEPLEVRDYRIGARFRDTVAEVIALTADGSVYAEPLAGEVDLRRVSWKYDEESGESTLEHGVIVSREFALDRGRAQVDFAAELAASADGWYEIVVRVGERHVLTSRGEPAPPPTTLRVTAPSGNVEPGATFPIVVHAPFTGDALVTLEGAGIHDARVVRLAEGSNRFDYTLPSSDRVLPSSAHIVIQMARPQREVAAQERAFSPAAIGAARLAIVRRDTVAEVRLEVPERVVPGADVEIGIEAPGVQEVVLFAVDEGELGRVGDRYADPLAFFHGPRALESLGATSSAALRSGARFESSAGGDAGDEEPLLSALAEGMLTRERAWTYTETATLDAQGRGRVRFRLGSHPAREGSLRLIALASGTRALGYATRSLRVAAPLSLQVAGPNLLREGDRAEMVVTLRNLSGAAQDVSMSLASEFATLDAAIPESYTLRDGAEERIIVPVRADHGATLGKLIARAAVKGQPKIDREVAMNFAIVAAEPLVRRVTTKRIDRTGEIAVDSNWTSPVDVEIEVDTDPRQRLGAARRSLAAYPYGCAEQVSSQILAHVALGVERISGDGGADAMVLNTLLRVGFEKLSAMQLDDGSFGFWRGSESLPLPTLQAFAALLELGDRGRMDVSSALPKLTRYVRNELARSPDPQVATLAIRLLSRAGVPVDLAVARIERAVMEGHSTAAKAQLAIVLAGSGEREKARTMLAGLVGGETGDGSALDTPMRGRAALLEALLAIDPADARTHSLANELLSSIEQPDQHTTSDLAPALIALSKYFNAFAERERASTIQFGSDGKPKQLIPTELAHSTQNSHRARLAPGERLSVVADGPVYCLVTEVGRRATSAKDGALALSRSIHDVTEDLPVLPGQPLQRGREYEVVITLDAKSALENVAIVAAIPAGCDGVRRDRRPLEDADYDYRDGSEATTPNPRREPDSLDLRPGNALMFLDHLPAGRSELRYRIRATFRGEFLIPPLRAEAMYRPGSSVIGGGGIDRVVVR